MSHVLPPSNKQGKEELKHCVSVMSRVVEWVACKAIESNSKKKILRCKKALL